MCFIIFWWTNDAINWYFQKIVMFFHFKYIYDRKQWIYIMSNFEKQWLFGCFNWCSSRLLLFFFFCLTLFVKLKKKIEFPGVILAAIVIDRFGRLKTMITQWSLLAISFGTFCLFKKLFYNFKFFKLAVLLFCVARSFETFSLGFGRAMITGAFQVLYIYTPEFYATRVR